MYISYYISLAVSRYWYTNVYMSVSAQWDLALAMQGMAVCRYVCVGASWCVVALPVWSWLIEVGGESYTRLETVWQPW